jgi:hypothetical protein
MEKKRHITQDIRLSKRQKDFADHYLICQCGQEAALKAGYTGNNLSVRGSRLLKNEAVRAYLEIRAKELVTSHAPQLVALADALKSKDQTLIYALKNMQECEVGSPTGYKYFELLCKLNKHLTENTRQNFFIDATGKDISIEEVIAEANEARLIMRQLRMIDKDEPAIESAECYAIEPEPTETLSAPKNKEARE